MQFRRRCYCCARHVSRPADRPTAQKPATTNKQDGRDGEQTQLIEAGGRPDFPSSCRLRRPTAVARRKRLHARRRPRQRGEQAGGEIARQRAGSV